MRNERFSKMTAAQIQKCFTAVGLTGAPVGLSADWNSAAWRVATDNSGEDRWGLFVVDEETSPEHGAEYAVIERQWDADEDQYTDRVVKNGLTFRAAIGYAADLIDDTTTDGYEAHEDADGEKIHVEGCGCYDCTGGRENDAPTFYVAF